MPSPRHRPPRPRDVAKDEARLTAVAASSDNRLLGLLSAADLSRLQPYLGVVHLDRKDVLFRAHEPIQTIYFPTTAVVSFVARLESGQMLEVGLVGRDGVVGAAVPGEITTMSCDAVVQIPGASLRIDADVLREELRVNEPLLSAIARFEHILLVRSMQIAACNMFHSVEERCIRWLLTVNDLTNETDIPLTHELLSTMLGVRRPTVTRVLGSLHRIGLVNEERGRIHIASRRRLESVCCECYRAMVDEQQRILAHAAD